MNVWYHFFLAALIRVLLILYGTYHDEYFAVKYTDVDYEVITDAAQHITKGESPFNRPTYRYTPFLAILMIPNVCISQFSGKLLFALMDLLTGFLIYAYCREPSHSRGSTATLCASLWWYNPLTVAISTRGNAESLMACATLATLLLLKRGHLSFAALVFGFSVHFKLYTIIYALPIFVSLLGTDKTPFVKRFFKPSKDSLVFATLSWLSFMVLTILAYNLYGQGYLEEAILYHVSRKDTRHNFSPYFYLFYLTDEWTSSKTLALMIFVPQFLVLVLVGLGLGMEKRDLALCVFCQTFVLVMLNKVCTSQYFVWFLCLLPVLVPNLRFTWRHWAVLAAEWFSGQALWLLVAYLLEFRGLNTFLYIWFSSLVFLAINVHILQQIIASYEYLQTKSD